MFIWLENTLIARWVGESYYAYPGLLSLHIVGLAILVGLFSMRDLKLLGLFPNLALNQQPGLKRLAVFGFFLNLLSGFLLFSSQASYLITSLPFLFKIGFISSGMTLALVIESKLKGKVLSDSGNERSLRVLAVGSLLVWTSAIVAGRLIAYL